MGSRSASSHILQTAIVLEEQRLVYVPVPKAASTTILWALAPLAGLSSDDFERSAKLEVTRSLAIHDLTVWGGSRLLAGRSSREVEEILSSRDWFRFTVVRDPTRRLWSAWVSKILVRDPRFVAAFGHEDWFPEPPASPRDVVDSFRRFLGALSERSADWHDPHWSPQSELVSVEAVPYDHVGRAERLDDTFAVLSERLGAAVLAPACENTALLPFSPQLFDEAALATSDPLTAADREAFAYERLTPSHGEPSAAWLATVEASLGAIQGVIDRNERIGDLLRLLREGVRRPRRSRIWAVRRS